MSFLFNPCKPCCGSRCVDRGQCIDGYDEFDTIKPGYSMSGGPFSISSTVKDLYIDNPGGVDNVLLLEYGSDGSFFRTITLGEELGRYIRIECQAALRKPVSNQKLGDVVGIFIEGVISIYYSYGDSNVRYTIDGKSDYLLPVAYHSNMDSNLVIELYNDGIPNQFRVMVYTQYFSYDEFINLYPRLKNGGPIHCVGYDYGIYAGGHIAVLTGDMGNSVNVGVFGIGGGWFDKLCIMSNQNSMKCCTCLGYSTFNWQNNPEFPKTMTLVVPSVSNSGSICGDCDVFSGTFTLRYYPFGVFQPDFDNNGGIPICSWFSDTRGSFCKDTAFVTAEDFIYRLTFDTFTETAHISTPTGLFNNGFSLYKAIEPWKPKSENIMRRINNDNALCNFPEFVTITPNFE